VKTSILRLVFLRFQCQSPHQAVSVVLSLWRGQGILPPQRL
jgi:hypothetical protein